MRSSGVFAVVVALVLAGWGVTRLNGPGPAADDPAEPEVAVVAGAEVDPLALPLHLPVVLPSGHVWVGEVQRQFDEGRLVAVTTAFEAADGAVVELCASVATHAERCGGGEPAGSGVVVSREVGEYAVLLRPVQGSFATPDLARFWESVELTSEHQRVDWLP